MASKGTHTLNDLLLEVFDNGDVMLSENGNDYTFNISDLQNILDSKVELHTECPHINTDWGDVGWWCEDCGFNETHEQLKERVIEENAD